MFILYHISSWFSTRFHILETDSAALRRNESNRQTLGLCSELNGLRNVSAFEFELKTSKQLFEEKKVFYSFDSFHVVMHQILRKLISVDYILYIIKCKMPLPQP
jgi:hypothetical protein